MKTVSLRITRIVGLAGLLLLSVQTIIEGMSRHWVDAGCCFVLAWVCAYVVLAARR